MRNDASKNFGNSFIKSITYETEYYTGGFRYQDHMSPETCVKTTVSKMYDIVLFLRKIAHNNNNISSSCINNYGALAINLLRHNGGYNNSEGYVFMNKMPTEWTVVDNTANAAYDNSLCGPYIEYNKVPSKNILIRRNGLSIERYCTGYDSNIDCQLLSTKNETYMVYGIMFEDHISSLLK